MGQARVAQNRGRIHSIQRAQLVDFREQHMLLGGVFISCMVAKGGIKIYVQIEKMCLVNASLSCCDGNSCTFGMARYLLRVRSAL